MRSYWIKVVPKSNDWCPNKEKEMQRHTKREEDHVKTEAEVGVTLQQGEEYQALLAMARS